MAPAFGTLSWLSPTMLLSSPCAQESILPWGPLPSSLLGCVPCTTASGRSQPGGTLPVCKSLSPAWMTHWVPLPPCGHLFFFVQPWRLEWTHLTRTSSPGTLLPFPKSQGTGPHCQVVPADAGSGLPDARVCLTLPTLSANLPSST